MVRERERARWGERDAVGKGGGGKETFFKFKGLGH